MPAAAPIAIESVGLITSLGLSTAATCAALRAGISNANETRFLAADGEWLLGHQVVLDRPWRGRTKLVKMAALAVRECIESSSSMLSDEIPLLLCVAESERTGRTAGLDDQLFSELEKELGICFNREHSAIVAAGRVSGFLALARARKLVNEERYSRVLVAASDSLLSWPTLFAYVEERRVLMRRNSNGFIPGEGAGAFLVGKASEHRGELQCIGIGFGSEFAHVSSNEPLRADGLTSAIRGALDEARCEMRDVDLRITDVSGEQYFFKEASLALSRTLRKGRSMVDIWHPASGIGETGAVAAVALIAKVWTASKLGYAPGSQVLLHASADDTRRAAAIVAPSGASHG